MAEQFRRKSPEEILQSISNMHRGRLKIILGAVSGSGKTYHLLMEGQSLKKKGIDVVVGMLGTATRPKLAEQLEGLEKVPAISWIAQSEEKCDLDVAAIVARDPEVVLVDGLAHRNRADAPRQTRLDDVLYLLNRNISVIATVNVYELAGMKELAERLTKAEVRIDQCVPEDTLALADEVKLLDVTPESMLKRLEEGNIEAAQTPNLLFRRDNLHVLRELALRFVANGVNEDLEDYREKHGMVGASGATERVLVSAQYHWNGSILVRRGQQVAKRLGGELLVVCFRSPAKKLTKEEATFRRSIGKLVEKVGGVFEERPLQRNMEVANELVAYAMDNNVTRIVMGQSKRTRWEEVWYGSVVHRILRKTRNIDILIVADRSERDGERVLPTKRSVVKPNPYRRLSEEEVEQEIGKIRRGTLKVYVGAAPGVGKTYTMLREGNELARKGIDVVIGLLETHGRKETLEQVGALPTIARKQIPYKNVVLEEMDTDAIIRRNPEVVLVDELAHTNVQGSINEKRHQDVEKILSAGVSVISTMNIQHLESLNDSVEQITGIRVRETVPDHILHQAEEVELIDISPKALRQRMREGNIYAMEKVEQSLNHFFKTGNLIALRELALREVADDVDERLEAWERRTLRGPWRQQEVIFVCVNLRADSERLIRRGFRIAYRLKAKWFVAYVQDHEPLTAEEGQQLEKLKKLTERLGGTFEQGRAVSRRKVFTQLVSQMNARQATQAVIGQSARTRWKEIREGSVILRLLREVRHMDVLVVADHTPDIG
ncbi:universal stress protein [Brevibacillus centrosporus]|uniref:universal stress protein n=1 Tax=Brevibacillus centrosporus TaxID=54910 RepID=UPI000F0A78A1|nr:universal stress protein [Brevibacillus centrosporus]MEC2128805.1 universal stress protein [Brevibacillus centrosporus]RNB71333.1 histidine kinase [Brevibacillus centrosporus]GED30556.1 potassium-transporting P-type ATPase D chain [Brevibacillus centrosporus]